jgi:hypothetical protein
MIECNEDVIARSLEAIAGWTSPGGLPCLFLFILRGDNRLRRMTVRPGTGTEPSMAKLGWIVQSAFYGRNSHATTESSPTPCRKAASFNQTVQRTGALQLSITHRLIIFPVQRPLAL